MSFSCASYTQTHQINGHLLHQEKPKQARGLLPQTSQDLLESFLESHSFFILMHTIAVGNDFVFYFSLYLFIIHGCTIC